MADASLVERILAARDRGLPDDAGALARALDADEHEVVAALAALALYDHRLAAERRRPSVEEHAHNALGPGTRLGDFEIVEELGHGAMGVVYRARQLSLDRLVALKVLPDRLARDERFVARFRREATLAAAIRHPHLAEVHGMVQESGTLAFAMRLVVGPSLHEVLTRLAREQVAPVRRTSAQHVRQCVLLARAIADALAVVHAAGLVHRDVKPSNILLEGRSHEPLDATPVLVDFGLLRATNDTSLTNTDTLLGTPAYAAHECVLGHGADARADVFSLAATLHDLLTVTSPGTRGPATAGLADVRAINPEIDDRLAAIVAMALHSDRTLRYEHCGALRDELDCYLREDPIRALPAKAWSRLRLWIRRDRARATRVAALVAAAIVAVSGMIVFAGIALDATRIADEAACCEREGDLVGAAQHFSTLREIGVARFLWWLEDDRAAAADYLDDNTLRPIVTQFAATLRSADAGSPPSEDSNTELLQVHDRLLRVLFDPRASALIPKVQAFLLRETTLEGSPRRRLAALDSWTSYLMASASHQRYPPVLPGLLQGLATRPDVGAEIREAATAALGEVRSSESFGMLVDILGRDNSDEALRLAGTCTTMLFGWLFRDAPSEFAKLDAALMETWGRNADLCLEKPHWDAQNTVPRTLLYWERQVEPSRELVVPPAIRALMARNADQVPTTPGVRPDIVDYDTALWKDAGPAVTLATRGPGQPSIGESQVVFDRSIAANRRPPLARVSGSIVQVTCVGATVDDGDGPTQPAFLCLRHPGQSRLTVVSEVPPSARCLSILVTQMQSGRGALRGQGAVYYRLRLAGIDAGGVRRPLPWEFSSLVRFPALDSENGPNAVDLSVPMQLLFDYPRLELIYEYVRGDTTHRLFGVAFKWREQ
ncbi:MAG TPA: serine/threonine-protein kinase [Planctomycetota bacterium]|nr:serine/threonine-protein kinase [Planctomycetota bacterium]